jgi:hypothetical protein
VRRKHSCSNYVLISDEPKCGESSSRSSRFQVFPSDETSLVGIILLWSKVDFVKRSALFWEVS